MAEAQQSSGLKRGNTPSIGLGSRAKSVANQVRLWLFILVQSGQLLQKAGLPEAIKNWSLTSIQTRLIKIGGRLVRHARRLVFQLAEVMVTREMFDEMLERIGRLRFNDRSMCLLGNRDHIEAALSKVRDLQREVRSE